MINLKNILVPTDFSNCSEAAVSYGLELARTFGATVHLLHVVQDPSTMRWAAEAFTASLGDLGEQLQADAQRRLIDAIPERERDHVMIACPIANEYAEIIRYATEQRMDLIVMGTHGRGLVAHALIGSVAERVIRRAPCPVLTVRHAQHSFLRDAAVPIEAEAPMHLVG